ncbi:MAG: hypothetical protein QOH33_1847 [Paraburkholderia sp.]|nr:hypothetical protein [Paraburkholderia sp.]
MVDFVIVQCSDGRGTQVAAGVSLTGPPLATYAMHVFVAHKAPWFEISDGLPQNAELPD